MTTKLIRNAALITIVASALTCCGIRTHFNKDEIAFVNAFAKEDTMVFVSTSGLRDTFLVGKPRFYYPEYMPIEVHGLWLPQQCEIFYKNRNYDIDSIKLLSAIKRRDRTSVVLSFMRGGCFFYYDELGSSLDSLTEFRKNEYQLTRPTNKKYFAAKLLVNKRIGIVGYTSISGEIWKRVK